jgi:hypothetical protein
MKNILIKFFITFLSIILYGCTGGNPMSEYPEYFTITVTNEINTNREDVCLFLDVANIKEKHPDFNIEAFMVTENKKELPSQKIKMKNMETKIAFLADFAPKETKEIYIRYAKEGKNNRKYTKRTQSVLSVKYGGEWIGNKYKGEKFKDTNYLKLPEQHTDHSEFVRFEGVGWESDKVGYRLYLDWRNGLDIFGKKVSDMALQDVGLDGYESYHETADWGQDILKVGDALGIGAVGTWEKGKVERVSKTDSLICKVLADGAVYSAIKIKYLGWETNSGKSDLISNLSIRAGKRLTKNTIIVDGNIPNLCTGIVKSENNKILKSEDKEEGWGYLASYGNQSIINDKLGMAIIFRNKDKLMITEDELNNVVVLKPADDQLTYYFLAAWEQEPKGIKNEEKFIAYLKKTIKELNSPILIEIM